MNTLYHDIVIDLNHMGFPESVTVKQYDDQIPHVRVELRQNGAKYMIPSGTTLRMQGTKPDGTHFMYDVIRTDDGRVDCPLTNQILAAAGPILTEVCMTDTTGELTTFNFYILAQKAALSREEIESSDDYESIDKIREETQKYKEQAEAAKTAAEAAKEAATKSANTATQQAQTAQLEAQKVKQIVAGNEAYTKTESDLKYTVAPRKEASSNTGELKLTDADEGLSYLALQGNSEQYTNTANKNLIDLNFATDGYSISSTGTLDKNEQYFTTGYIVVEPGEQYTFTRAISISNRQGCFYDKDKIFLQPWTGDAGLSKNTVTVPENVKYLRLFDYISHKEASQLEKGNTATDYVPGAVDTPSPEYPSEVRSVGDIPKDVNGVEIRNLLDEEWIKSQPESAWVKAVSGSNTQFRLKLGDELKKKVMATAFFKNALPSGKSFSFTLGNQAGVAGISLIYNNTIGTGTADYATAEYVNLYITVNGTTTATHEQMLEVFNYFNFMVTSAAEIDEYRPYIGENNGLVKIESIGKNLALNSEIIGQATNAGVTVTTNEDQTFNISGTLTAGYYNFYRNKVVPLEPGETYTITSNLQSSNLNIVLQKVDKNNNAESSTWVVLKKGQNKATTVFDGENLKGCNIVIQPITQGSAYNERNIYIQIEKGSVQTKYQPGRQQITWIPLKEPLQALRQWSDNSIFYRDTVDKEGNVIQQIEKIIYDGSSDEGWLIYQYTNLCAVIAVPEMVVGSIDFKPISSHFKSVASISGSDDGTIGISVEGYSAGVAGFFIGVKGIAASEAEWRTWLQNSPIACFYALGEEYYKKYQIPAVYIETHDLETNVRCLNKVKPSDMTLDYKLAMSSLIKRLEALEEKTVQEV